MANVHLMCDQNENSSEIEIAARLLAGYDATARIVRSERLSQRSRARVWRLWLDGAKMPASPTLICKFPFEKTACAYDEWAGLQFLTQIASEAVLAPQLIAGDEDSGVILMQDLGGVQDLSPLATNSPESYRASCVGLARYLARMHSCAAGIEESYAAIRQDLPLADQPVRTRQAADFREACDAVCHAITQAGVSIPSGFHDEYEVVARTIEEPGLFLTFTHGDMAPSNCVLAGGSLFLIDFEWCGYRHALYDALFWQIIFPFPNEIILAMDSAYRREFGAACPLALDDTQYHTEMARLCAHHVLSFVRWWFPGVIERDGAAAPGITRRQMFLFKLERFVTLEGARSLPAIHSTLARLTRQLRSAWPDTPHMPTDEDCS